MEVGRSRRAVREAAAVPRCGGTARRREAQRPRRVCAGDLKEAQHDCTFGGAARRTALPEVSLSQPLVELLPGDVRLLVSGWGGVDVGGPGGEKLLFGAEGPSQSLKRWEDAALSLRRRPLSLSFAGDALGGAFCKEAEVLASSISPSVSVQWS